MTAEMQCNQNRGIGLSPATDVGSRPPPIQASVSNRHSRAYMPRGGPASAKSRAKLMLMTLFGPGRLRQFDMPRLDNL